MLDRTIAPATGKISNLKFTRAYSVSLSNGIPIHIIDAGPHDIVRLEILLKSGRWYEQKKGAAYFASQMLLEGTSKISSRELAGVFEFNGAHVNVNSGIDYNILVTYVMNSKLSEIAGFIRDCLLDPAYPAEELTTLKDIKQQQIRINNEKNNYIAGREIRKLLFGHAHPYGKELMVEDINRDLSRDLLIQYYNQDLLNGIELIISGQISDRLIKDLQVFNDLPVILPQERSWLIETGADRKVMIPKKDSLQASIRLGRHIIPKSHADYLGLSVLNVIFGGFFGCGAGHRDGLQVVWLAVNEEYPGR